MAIIKIVEGLEESIREIEGNDGEMQDRSWGMEEGVLISGNDAKEIVEFIRKVTSQTNP